MLQGQVSWLEILKAIGVIATIAFGIIGIRRANKKDIENQFSKKADIDEVEQKFCNMETQINLKIESVAKDVSRHETLFSNINKKLDDMPEKVVRLIAPLVKK